MILIVENMSSRNNFVLINRFPWLSSMPVGILYDICAIFPDSIIRITVPDIKTIRTYRKTFAPLVKNQPELHLGEIIQQTCPELFL